MASDLESALAFAHWANIKRYRRLLATHLTAHDRRYIEEELAQEQAALERLAVETAPGAAREQASGVEPSTTLTASELLP
jgi:hypothetical protein